MDGGRADLGKPISYSSSMCTDCLVRAETKRQFGKMEKEIERKN